MPEPITIAGIQIRRDHEGRFCINDLHRASGEEKRHQPSNWLGLQQTQALIGAIERAAAQDGSGVVLEPLVSRQRIGTFGVKSLVYAYAMWVSPEFNLRVIEAYDALQMQSLQQRETALMLPDFSDPIAAARAWADEAEKVKKLATLAQVQNEHLEAAKPALEFHAAVSNSQDSVTIGQFAKLMSAGEVRLFDLLRRERILMTGGARHNLPYQQHVDAGRFRVNEAAFTDREGRTHLRFQTRITPKGQIWLQQRYFPTMVDAVVPVPELFAPQVPQPVAQVTHQPPQALAAPSEPSTTTMANVEAEIARLRRMRDEMAIKPRRLLQAGPAPMARAEVPQQVRAVGNTVQSALPLNDDLGELSHPGQEREALIERFR